ncbi:phage tail protein (plasmid) [Cereibacter azotoformans]|uniref:phage tail protein n=1 Tax=Cereibacter azotoformans TaxID=43057 RepID=UPI001EEC3117|nr:phage tail protein [Cereibacter azotoformans]ULB12645.1 phage tail protein [Cereibacter azotoformans]
MTDVGPPASPRVQDTAPPFLRLSARLGWPLGPPESRPGIPHADRPLALAIAGRSAIPLAEPFGTFGGRTLPKGLAISSDGRMYLADPVRRVILTAQAGADPAEVGPFEPLWPARPLPAPSPCDPAEDGPPRDPFALVEPVDVALAPSGDLAILDRGARRVLVLALPLAALRHAAVLEGGRPEAIAYDAAGRLYVALTDPGHLRRHDGALREDPTFPRVPLRKPTALAAARAPSGGGCAGDGCAAIPPPPAVIHALDGGRMVSYDARGRGVTVAEDALDLALPPLRRTAEGLDWADPGWPGHAPILFRGLAPDATGRHGPSRRPLIALPRRIEVPRAGGFTTLALDSGRTGFAWDRITFDLDLPVNTRLVFSTLTADAAIPFDRLALVPEDRWSRPLVLGRGALPEGLVQSGPGRFLWLRVELSGDGRASPLVRVIDIHGPRRSSLRHLPAPFHEDPESARFLDRFLGYFDTVFAEIAARHRSMEEILDPRVVPEGFLSWLGAWFDLEFLASWPEATRRAMIAQAIGHFRQRGTIAGLKRILQWHTGLADPLPQVIEHFRLPPVARHLGAPDGPVIGGAPLDPAAPAHRFTIVLPAHLAATPEARATIERLVAASVPAHARFALRLFEPGVAIGSRSTLGVDMILGPTGLPLGAGRLGASLTTAPRRPADALHLPHLLSADPGEGALPC